MESMKANLFNVLLLSTLSLAVARGAWPSSKVLHPGSLSTSQTIGFLGPNLAGTVRTPLKHAVQRQRQRGRLEAFDSPVERYTSGVSKTSSVICHACYKLSCVDMFTWCIAGLDSKSCIAAHVKDPSEDHEPSGCEYRYGLAIHKAVVDILTRLQ